MRSVLFLSVTYAVDGFSNKARREVAPFYFTMLLVFLFMDVVEILKG